MSIDIAAFEAVLPDPEAIRAAAGALVSAVGDIMDTAEESATAWGHLRSPDVYEIAGSEVVFNAFRPVTSSVADLDSDVGAVDKAVLAYADTVDALKVRLDAVKADAANFFSRTRGRSQDDWDDDEGLIQAEQNIIGDLNRLYSDLQEAQRVCANAISAIYGGPKYVLTSEEGAGTGEVEFGFSGEQLDAAAAEGNVPWGQPTEWDKPWYRDAWDGVASFGKGVWSGVAGTVTGLGNMVGLGGAEAFEQTWKGLGNLAVNLAIMTSPVVQVALHASGNSDRVRQAGDDLLAVGKAAIHWDEWQTDPAYAAGATSFDLASILLTAGAGATAKVGSAAGKIGDAANASGKVSAVVKASGIGKVAGVTVKVTDAAQTFRINAITTVVDTSRVTVGKVGAAWQAADQFLIDARLGGKGDAGDMLPGAAAVDDAAAVDGAAGGPRHGDADSPAPPKPVVHYDAAGRIEKVDLGDRTHTVSTRNDQIAQLQRSLDPATWKNTDGFLATHLSPSEFLALDGLRGPDGKLPPNVVETQVADLVEKAFDGETRGPVRPGASPLENALRGIPARYYYDLTDAQAIMVHDVRHLLGSGDISQPFQKIFTAEDAAKVMAGTDAYPGTMGSFISQASDTAGLRTVDEIILGLRLDYMYLDRDGVAIQPVNMPFKAGETQEVYAVRFSVDAEDGRKIVIPDGSNHARVEELRRDRAGEAERAAAGSSTAWDWELQKRDWDRETALVHKDGHPWRDSAAWPNNGWGTPSSRVEHTPLIPELKVDGGVPIQDGAEMWRIDRQGNEVLVGIYDFENGKWNSL